MGWIDGCNYIAVLLDLVFLCKMTIQGLYCKEAWLSYSACLNYNIYSSTLLVFSQALVLSYFQLKSLFGEALRLYTSCVYSSVYTISEYPGSNSSALILESPGRMYLSAEDGSICLVLWHVFLECHERSCTGWALGTVCSWRKLQCRYEIAYMGTYTVVD